MAERRTREKKKKKKKRFTLLMQKKMVVIFFCIILLLFGLNFRIVTINAGSGDSYTKKVLSQQEFDSRSIPYCRGAIKDRNGTTLAVSQKVYNIILDCKVINSKKEYKEPTIDALVKCFTDLNEEELRKVIEDKPDSQYYILKKKLSYDEIQPFVKIQNDTKNNPNVKGVWFEDDYIRYYPYGSLACHVLGYTNSGNAGAYGIEEYYNSVLNGVNGREYGYLNDDSNLERTINPATDGNTVISTIDANIQSIVEKHVKAFNEEHRDEVRDGRGSNRTAVIIQDPNTGEILAEAVYPNYDLNNPRELVATELFTEEEAQTVDSETAMNALNGLWKNFCVSDTYEPGSTAKPFTIATGLETGALSGDETYICDGGEMVSGYPKPVRCVNRNGHGQETIAQALSNSCNDALMQMSFSIGIKNFTKFQAIFGFGKKTGIDLPGEVNAANLMYTEETMTQIDLATNSFGQNFNVTMTQLMSGFCSLINGGYYYEPHVVKKIVDANGGTVKNIEPKLLRQTVSKETSNLLKEYLQETVMNGTAKHALVEGYTMGGKTGTAEKLPRKQGNYLVSFIGFAPVENPQLAIYVVVDEPNVADQAHSSFAQTIAKDILTEVLPYMNVFPATQTEEDTNNEQSQQQAEGDTQAGEGSTTSSNPNPSVDRITGEALDPATGEPLDPTSSVLE